MITLNSISSLISFSINAKSNDSRFIFLHSRIIVVVNESKILLVTVRGTLVDRPSVSTRPYISDSYLFSVVRLLIFSLFVKLSLLYNIESITSVTCLEGENINEWNICLL